MKIECGIGSLDSLESWCKMYIENPAIRWTDGTWPIGWLLVRGTKWGLHGKHATSLSAPPEARCGIDRFGARVVSSFRSHSFAIMKAFMSQSSELLLGTTCTAQVSPLWSMFGMLPLPGVDPRTAFEFRLFGPSAVSRRLRRRGFPPLVTVLAEPAAMMLRLWTMRHGSVFLPAETPC